MNKLDSQLNKTSHYLNESLHAMLKEWGMNEQLRTVVVMIILILLTSLSVYLFHFLVRRVIRIFLNIFIKSDKEKHINTHLKNNHFAFNLAQIFPLVLIDIMLPIIFENYPRIIVVGQSLLEVYTVFLVIRILMAILNAFGDKLKQDEKINQRPISSYLQVFKIVFYLFGATIIFSKITGKDPLTFFSIMGAASAILLLMFKDTIMGFMASIQVTINDMVRIGDWIEMPKYGADGDVTEINLTTVKVQNWDKTITTVPTHTLITDSFKNWRGMKEFGGRRLKRSILIKQNSIHFIADHELEEYSKIQGIKNYIVERKKEIDIHNEQIHADRVLPLNGRNLTNAGLFRKYATWYINNHPGVHKDKIMMVRQMAPTEKGLPLEIYFFTNTTVWTEYEAIVSDVFDHLFASISYFGLEIFETPTGNDIQKINRKGLKNEDF